jgi:Flp pilus assembly CpaF family ATPase
MLNLLDSLVVYIDKYKEQVIEALGNRTHSSGYEAINHTQLLAEAGSGSEAAKDYVKGLIKTSLISEIRIDSEDIKAIREIVVREYKILINKEYEVYSDDADVISYYQLIDEFKGEKYTKKLRELNIDEVDGIDEFVDAIFMDTYGNKYVETLDELLINNIEVHGIRKIKIETNKGKWKNVEGYHFRDEKQIQDVADHIISEDNKGQLTEENCVMEGIMKNGNRVTIGLKPANYEHNIFIKKFNGFSFETIEDLVDIGEITEQQLEELRVYAKGRANICFIGGVNAGKTTFMKAYVGLIPDEYKIGTIATDFESHLIEMYPDKDIVSMAATKKYTVNDLFVSMLRMNRNILSLEEARSYEVEQYLKGMLRGADGSFSTGHSRTVHDLINNLAWMSLENGLPMDIRILRYRIASAIDIVVRLWHAPNGKRYVDSIDEIITVHNNLDMPYRVNNIYKYDLDEERIIKTGNISPELQEKFRYYKCTKDDIEKIKDPSLER